MGSGTQSTNAAVYGGPVPANTGGPQPREARCPLKSEEPLKPASTKDATIKAKTVFNKIQNRKMSFVQRIAFGISVGVIVALGMWLISTLRHAQDYNIGLTLQDAIIVVLVTGVLFTIISGGGRSRPKSSTPPKRQYPDDQMKH